MPDGHPIAPRLLVWFEGEVALIGDEVPDQLTLGAVLQAVQNEVGHTGIAVTRISSYSLDATDE